MDVKKIIKTTDTSQPSKSTLKYVHIICYSRSYLLVFIVHSKKITNIETNKY